MAQNTSISLGPHFTNFIAEQVAEGRYSSASEVVRAGLRLLEEHEGRVSALKQALEEGEASGFIEHFDSAEFLAGLRAKHGAKA